jgi:hypothetical protein
MTVPQDGATPAHLAARCNKVSTLDVLIDYGASLDSADDVMSRIFLSEGETVTRNLSQHGCTPLHDAIVMHKWEAAELLVQRGARLHVRNTVRSQRSQRPHLSSRVCCRQLGNTPYALAHSASWRRARALEVSSATARLLVRGASPCPTPTAR